MSNKTAPTGESVEAFLSGIEDEQKRRDSFELLRLFAEATGEEPVMWGDSIVGYGTYHYRYASGREGDWFLAGFSPRKNALTLYIMAGFDHYDDLLADLGKFKTGKSCLYVKRLDDVDRAALKTLIAQSAEHVARTNA